MGKIGANSYRDGILQGVVITPSTNEQVDIRYVGSPMELMQVAMFLGLEPVGEPDEDEGVISLTDERGGFATLAPTDRASDLLHTVAAMQQKLMESGDPEEMLRRLRDGDSDGFQFP